jgi:hypothetical protein
MLFIRRKSCFVIYEVILIEVPLITVSYSIRETNFDTWQMSAVGSQPELFDFISLLCAPTHVTIILMLFFHLCLDLESGCFPWDIPHLNFVPISLF